METTLPHANPAPSGDDGAPESIGRDIVVVGASAGGVEALRQVAASLPPDLDAAVLVVLHVPAEAPSALARILDRVCALPVTVVEDNERPEPGHVYVARPDHHLLVWPGRMRVVRGPRENNHRPAIDPLFRTAAAVYGPRAIAVILSGALDDGTAGVAAITRRGGVAIIQEPEEAMYGDMPANAIAGDNPHYVVPLAEIGPLIGELAGGGDGRTAPETIVAESLDERAELAASGFDPEREDELDAVPSPYACPECGGVLWDRSDGDVVRFRCRVGHAYSVDSLEHSQHEAVDTALWSAIRALEERASLALRVADRVERGGAGERAERHRTRAQSYERQADSLRRLVTEGVGDRG